MKKYLFVFVICLLATVLRAQTNDNFQSDPKQVLEEVFRAAKNSDFSNLHQLCPPDKSNDGDTQKYICDVATSSEQIKSEFIAYFKEAHITGDVVYLNSPDGVELAEIPFWFNHPSGGNRCNEVMKLVKVDKKWYLLSF
jgi:hypothetical protein